MNILIVSSKQDDVQALSAKLLQQDVSVTVWIVGQQDLSDPSATLKNADLIITLFKHDSVQISTPSSASYPFEAQKAIVLNNMLSFAPYAQSYDSLANLYAQSKSTAPILHAGTLADFAITYLYKKFGIVSYGITADTSSLIDTLVSQTHIKGITANNLIFAAAGVGNTLWITALKDKTGRDVYPLFRVAASEEALDVSRFELSLCPLKSLKFFGYYHSALTAIANDTDFATSIAKAFSADTASSFYLTTVNNDYIYGAPQDAPAILPCTVSAKGLMPQKADLPLQCVLASNDYSGALLTAVSAVANKSVTLFKRAVKLDPYIASILALDEAETLADSVLMANPTALAFFGGK